MFVFFEDFIFYRQWDFVLGGFGSLSWMEFDELSIQELVQQFEVLLGDLVGLFLDGIFCFLYIVIGYGLVFQEIVDVYGFLFVEVGWDDLLSFLYCEECLFFQFGFEEFLEFVF